MEEQFDTSKAAMSRRLNEVFLYIRKNTEYVTQTLFAQKIKEPRSNLSAALNGNEKYMTEGVVKKVVAAFPEIDKEWMLSGRGEMLVEGDYEDGGAFLKAEREKYGLTLTDIYEHTHIPVRKLKAYEMHEEEMPDRTRALLELYFDQVAYEYESQDDEDLNIPILKTEVVSSSVKVPYYDVDFAGGWSTEELFSQSKPSFIISSPDFDRADFACNLIGNSISRRIRSGSVIGLKRIEDWQTYFPTNELYGVITKNQIRTVKIVKRSKQKGFLELIPDPLPELNNPPYEPELIPMTYVVEFYQVVAWAFFERIAM